MVCIATENRSSLKEIFCPPKCLGKGVLLCSDTWEQGSKQQVQGHSPTAGWGAPKPKVAVDVLNPGAPNAPVPSVPPSFGCVFPNKDVCPAPRAVTREVTVIYCRTVMSLQHDKESIPYQAAGNTLHAHGCYRRSSLTITAEALSTQDLTSPAQFLPGHLALC